MYQDYLSICCTSFDYLNEGFYNLCIVSVCTILCQVVKFIKGDCFYFTQFFKNLNNISGKLLSCTIEWGNLLQSLYS